MDKDAAEVNTVAPPPYQQNYGQPQGQWPAGQPQPLGYGQPGQAQVITSQGYAYGQPGQPQVVVQGYFQPSQPQGYQQPGQPAVITTETNVPKVVPGTVVIVDGDRPPDRTVLAWLACIFCFWPTGICAIMYAHQAKAEMDRNVAMAKTRQAQTYIIISVIVGIICYIAIIIFRSIA